MAVTPEGLTAVEGRESNVESSEKAEMKTPVFRFEKLETWQLARKFNHAIYAATRSFPPDERYALTSQLRRASVSVSSNIAEGSGRNSDSDFAHFLEVAYGSLMEVVAQLFLASNEGYLPDEALTGLLAEANQLAGKLVTFSKTLGRAPRINLPAAKIALAPRPSTLDS